MTPRARSPHTRLEALRVSRGLTQTELAAMTGISQAVLSKLEAGALPLDDRRRRAIEVHLGDPVEGDVPAVELRHRLQVSVPAKVRRKLISDLALEHVRRRATDRTADATFTDMSDTQPLHAAQTLRRAWRLEPGPIGDLRGLVEAGGVACVKYNLRAVRVAAIGSWAAGERPIILVSPHVPRSELRWAVAHELGHALLRSGGSEQEANEFAAELLMPAADLRPALADAPVSRLKALAAQWGVSPMVLARRASDLRAVSGVRFRELRAALRSDRAADA